MKYYDKVNFLNYIFYLVLEDSSLKYCSINKLVTKDATYNKEKLIKYTNWLKKYFEGYNKKCSYELTFNKSDFINNTHKKLLKIPYGEKTTYKKIATSLNKPNSSRAVGNAVGKNDLLIFIPCHRVIRSDGKLGGFSAGRNLKNILLKLEENSKN